jgi:hypothetical protein
VTQVSKDGGLNARWRRDGKELFFEALDGRLMAVEMSTEGPLRLGKPVPLFPLVAGPITGALWDVSADGKRFLVAMPTTEFMRSPITVVLNWWAAPAK